ncbi:hypothetical protein [Streptococcus sp. E17BB]|uniref:hypothetical protein n=1 Tax=Streptococcus sp. E17BB TaxID=3278714 RepID=UPI00359D5A4C
MKALILSFSPAVFPSLLTGQKQFEYRKRLPKGDLRAYLYLSSPVKAIVGYLDLEERLEISDLLASDLAEPIKARLFRFTETYAFPIKSLGLFDEPVPLETIRELGGQPPQSFVYAQTYPLLTEALCGQSASVYPINPNQALDGLGWFSQEILNQHPRVIPLPASLLCHFPKEKI